MISVKTVVLSILFLSVTCYKFNNSNSMSANTLNSHTNLVEILELCFTKSSNLLVVTPNLVDIIYKNLPNTFTAFIIFLDDNFASQEIQLYLPSYPTYILSTPGVVELNDLVKKIKSSAMWSIHSKFLVIGNPEEFCSDALPILKELWKFELLSSVVVCSEAGNSSLYTYNPYTDRAPVPWLKVEGSDRPDERWTLYKTSLIHDSQLCDVLTFEKTKFLDGYPLKVISHCEYKTYLEIEIIPSLNMTLIMTCVPLNHDHPTNMNSIRDGTQDLISDPRIEKSLFPELIIPSFATDLGFVIVTQKRSFSSSIADFPFMFNVTIVIAMIFVILMIIVLIFLTNEYELVAALRDVLLFLLRMGIETPLDHFIFKIIFLIGFFFAFYFSPTFEAGIFSVLTHRPSHNIETLKDLHQHKYHLYYPIYIHNLTLQEDLWTSPQDMKYLHPHFSFASDSCLELASKDNTVACIGILETTLSKALVKKLHISSKPIFKDNYYYLSRRNWPLNKKVGVKIKRLFETGFVVLFKKVFVSNPKKMMKFFERILRIEATSNIDFEDLTYLYIFVAFCQIFATFSFAIEHFIAYLYRRG